MFKLILITVQITVLFLFSLLIINNSFIISFEINDLIYSVNSPYLILSVIIFFVLIFLCQSVFFKIKYKFINLRNKNKLKNKEKGYEAFVDGMIALSNKDYKKAIIESNKVSRQLNDKTPLSLLIKSEIYKVENKYEELNNVYEEMSKHKSTQNLGYRGIMEQYLRSNDYHHAFIYGEKLFNNNPFIEKIYETLLNIVVKTSNWNQLLIITDKAYSKKIISKKSYQENKSIAFFEIAKIKQLGEISESISYIKKALLLRKNFAPYVKLYLELLIQNKNYLVAKKLIRKSWTNNPHPEYKSVIAHLAKCLKMDILDLAKFISSSSIKNEDSKLLIVEASISSKKWNDARMQIKEFLDVQPKKAICLLMAKIEEGESMDMQKSNSWMLRSKNGQEDNIWICIFSNKTQREWTSVSSSGYFNSLEWKKPVMIDTLSISEN